MQDRFDSLEFYAKTNTNSSVFHNLIPSTYYPNGNKSSSGESNSNMNSAGSTTSSSTGATISLNTSRSRTPAPIPPRPRIPTSSSSNLSSTNVSLSNNYSNGINYGTNTNLPSGSFDSSPSSNYNRSSSRQSSVERNMSYPAFENFSTRSRNSSPSRFETSTYTSDRTGANLGRSSILSSLPPHPTSFHYDSYSLRSNARREPSVERFAQLRNRREASQERAMRPSVSSSYLTNRRSSFVDHAGSKYY